MLGNRACRFCEGSLRFCRVLCFSSSRREQIADWIRQGALISVISRIEVLGFSQPQREHARARTFLTLFQEIDLEEDIVEKTISVRRRQTIKVPDAIITATALDLDLPLQYTTKVIRLFIGACPPKRVGSDEWFPLHPTLPPRGGRNQRALS
ncbi:PIN domain-containing protein [Longimonas sp.]|uniref:PIN domain-containing protein n=1 Tax=Longimonas sp. TaxID=2039626 RepID=UPI003974AAE6